jgi:organic radical activating enzyme
MISNVCNYKCGYCFDGSNEGTHRFKEDWNTVVDNLTYLFDYYRKNSIKKKFEISLLGGEPTLWKNLPEFCAKLKAEHNVSIMIVSNGFRTKDWWERNACNFDQVILSLHVQEADIDHFIQVADCLYENNVVVTGLVMMDPTRWDECINAIEKLKASNNKWAINLQSLESTSKNTVVYTPEQINFIKENSLIRRGHWFYLLKNIFKSYYYQKEPVATFASGETRKLSSNEIMLNEWNQFENWKCNIGIDCIFVGLDGNISGTCGQILYGETQNYNLYDAEFKSKFSPNIQPAICQQKSCLCVSEANLTKEVTNKYSHE